MTRSTSHCSAVGHPEIRIEIAAPFASTADWLVNFFEAQVAAGKHFEANQTVAIGWSLLQLRESAGALEAWEPDFDAMPIRWSQGVNNTLRHLTLQRSMCDVLKCDPVFPSIRHAGTVSPRFLTRDAFTMSRDRPSGSDSGWVFAEDERATSEGEFISLYQIALTKMRVIPFLALPETTIVCIQPGFIRVKLGNLEKSSRDTPLLWELAKDPVLV